MVLIPRGIDPYTATTDPETKSEADQVLHWFDPAGRAATRTVRSGDASNVDNECPYEA